MSENDNETTTAAGGLCAPFPLAYSAAALGAATEARPRISDSFPRFRILSDSERAEAQRQAQVRERERVLRQRGLDDLFAGLLDRTAGVVRQLLEMHKPDLRWSDEQPECQHCSTADHYGHVSPHWPCATVRIVARDLGVELPDPDEDDDL